VQESAAEEGAQLTDDEAGEASTARVRIDSLEEGLQLGREHAVEHGLLGLAPGAGAER
jgi:hypothetical protein